MSDVKLCKDCKHVNRGWIFGYRFARCGAIPDLVSGDPRWYCDTERNHQFDGISPCGSTGKLWEEKPPSFVKRIWMRLTA
jgi:hypothetical protein